MTTPSLFHRVGNQLYKYAFPIYWPAYRVFKIYTDRAERQLLRRNLFPGAIVVDAGANVGVYSRFLSHCVGPGGMVHSFEPSPDNFRRLQAATRHLRNVRINRAAVGDYTGQSSLYISDDLNVDHRAYAPIGHSRRALSIDIVALDDYFKPHETIDLIKLDVQGYELHALRGAERILQENRNIRVLLEFWPFGLKQAGATWRELVTTLERHGLAIQQFSANHLEPFRATAVQEEPEWYINLFASRQ